MLGGEDSFLEALETGPKLKTKPWLGGDARRRLLAGLSTLTLLGKVGNWRGNWRGLNSMVLPRPGIPELCLTIVEVGSLL